MTELLRKEWRDARWIIIGLWVLAPIASLALKFLLLGGNRFDENASAGGFIPAMLLLYVLAVGADLVAADASSGRIGFLVALPVRPRTLWAVKAGFLFGGAFVYFVALLLMEAMFLSLCGLNGLLVFVPGLPKYAFLYAAVAVVAAATLMYSTLIDRGFAAVVAALLTVGGIAALAWYLDPEPRKEAFRSCALGLSASLFVAMLAGSYLAFTRGRIHVGGRLRRFAFAGGAFALLFLTPVGLTVANAARRLHIGLHDRDVEAGLWAVDDEGDWAVGFLHRGRKPDPLLGVRPGVRLVGVNLQDGRLRDLGMQDDQVEVRGLWFPARGRCVIVDSAWFDRFERLLDRRREYNLDAGCLISTTHPDPADVLWPGFRYANGAIARCLGSNHWEVVLPGGDTVRLQPFERPYRTQNSWGVVIHAGWPKPGGDWILRVDTGERIPIPGGTGSREVVLLPSTPNGSAFLRAKLSTLIRLPMDGSAPDRVFRGWGSTTDRLSPTGDHLLVWTARGLHLLRAEGARVLRLEGPRLDPEVVYSRWEKGGTRFVVRGLERLWLGDAADEKPKLTPLPIPSDAGNPVWFSGDRLLLEDGRLTLWTLDGKSRQILPAKEIP